MKKFRRGVAYLTSCHVLAALAVLSLVTKAEAANRTWTGGDATWTEGVTTGWNPADEPDADDTAIFNTANAVQMGSNNALNGLTMSGGIDLFTNDFDLDVDGLIQLSNSSTNLIVGGADSLLTADSVTINNLANLQVDGGTITINEESGNGLLDINAGGELVGHGTLIMTDAVAANTTLIVNDGFITAQRSPLTIFGAPQVGTLSLSATDADARIDLDGAAESGGVLVRRNQTLDVNIPLADIFNGSISMFQESKLDMSASWIMGANATIDIDNGFIDGTFPLPDVPAGIATIAGASFSQNSGTITIVDIDGTLKFDAPFSMNGGTLNNDGHLIFDQTATIGDTANLVMGFAALLTVEANRTVTINQDNFNLDGVGANGTAVITVNAGGTLNIDVTDYEPDSATNAFDGTININSGTISVSTSDAEFVMDGTLNMNKSGAPVVEWEGADQLDIGNDVGALDANLNILGNGNTLFHSQVDFNADADVHIATGCGLILNQTTNFNTVNGVNNAEFTGTGALRFNGQVNVNEAVTFNMTGGIVDFDGLDTVNGDTINVDAPVTVNAATMDSFGKVNTSGANTLDINNSVGTGVLTVNLDNANAEWTLNSQGVMNLVNDNTVATLLAGNDVNINGTVNVTGNVRTTARLDIASTALVNILTAAQPLRLAGGNDTNDPNTISGGTITGVGVLGADTDVELIGFGTINTQIDFDGSAGFYADNGTLTILGTILDAGQIGTADADGTLHVTNAWNNSVTAGLQLHGGTLSGGTITNDTTAGISGNGLVTARVINNSQLFASLGGPLIFDTPGDDNDWDGTTGAGELEATSVTGTDLELRDNATFGFTGTVRANTNNTVFANGFALDFNPGSTLSLATGGTYRSTSSTDIGGVVTVGVGGATIEVANNSFLTFETGSSTTLGSNLQLKNNNINIEDGATFSGAGALIIPDGSHMVIDNQADVGVLLDMQGALRPGNFNGIGRVNLFEMQMSNTSELFVELIGTSLNQFDRLVANGDVIVDGYLNIDIDEISPGVPFVPALGQTFNIITANTVTGEFDFADVSGMPAGLAFHIEYLANAVQLQVVTKPIFSADFDEDGDVDQTDLAIWQGAYDLNQLGDADGDNDTDGRDFLIWQRQYGSAPLQDISASTAVPEPNGRVLVAMLILGFLTVARTESKV